MLAFESSHPQQHLSHAYAWGTDSSIYDPYPGFGMSIYGSVDPTANSASIPYSYCENPSIFSEATQDHVPSRVYRSNSVTGPVKAASQHSEMPPSSLSTASGPSIPSASSSTVGSPFAAHAHLVSYQKDPWSTANQGLGLSPAIVTHEGYGHDFANTDMHPDLGFATMDKSTEDFVGEWDSSSYLSMPSSAANATHLAQTSQILSSSRHLHASPQPTAHTIDSILDRATSASISPAFVHSSASGSGPSFASSPATPGICSTQPGSSHLFKSPSTPASARLRAPSYPLPANASRSAMAAASAAAVKRAAQTPSPILLHPPAASPSSSLRSAGHFQDHFFAQSSGNFMPPLESSYPSLIQPARSSLVDSSLIYPGHVMYPAISATYHPMSPAGSPAPSAHDHSIPPYQGSHFSSGFSTYNDFPPQMTYPDHRRSSISSFHSKQSHSSPMSGSADLDEEGKEKGRCPNPDCGRVFKDLKAHMLTHQSERPEKCPILNCEYNQKGFARKYDKNRHTLTHYKGTMVCGFCPGSGSAAEKSFNRADVFKRHLTSVHGVEQSPPNSRRRSPTSSNRKITSYCHDATGKCSTCSATFNNAQDFYEHLDDCVLRVVQQEEPSEAINQQRLAEIATDDNVKDTMDRHMLMGVDETILTAEDDFEAEDDDDEDEEEETLHHSRAGKGVIKSHKPAPGARAVIGSSISKPGRPARKGLTHSKGGVPPIGKGRRKRKHYPPAWGVSPDKIKMKKRVLCVYDGERRLWKDDMMLDSEFEVRMNLAGSSSYVTDSDVVIVERANAIHNATPDEKGPWIQEETPELDLEELMS